MTASADNSLFMTLLPVDGLFLHDGTDGKTVAALFAPGFGRGIVELHILGVADRCHMEVGTPVVAPFFHSLSS